MRAFALLCATLTFVAPPVIANSRDDRKPITVVERQLDQIREARAQLRENAPYSLRDMRGRIKLDDIEQWAYTPELEQQVASLIDAAHVAKPAELELMLADAHLRIDAAMARALEIASYWKQSNSFVWRERWKAFAAGNGLPTEPYDEKIIAAERSVIDHLNSGDFVSATSGLTVVESGLQSAISAATTGLVRARNSADLKFIPRSTRCPGTDGPAATARLIGSASPSVFYPAASKRRFEEGAIVVRARVSAAGCATDFALVVSSGYPDLDAAAIRLSEESRFAAATEDGQPAAGEVTFKIRFNINLEPAK